MFAPASQWHIFCSTLLMTCAAVISSEYEHHDKSWRALADTRTPADIMVDVVNDLGLNILKIHNTNNENNIALSPYGVASILTALLEGVRGRAALEIQKCGGFPADQDVVRVGLRDIHRLLRSYFIPQEGFLSGLSLSSEKVTLKPEYQSILRFYGFDMTSFNTPIYPNVETTTPLDNITTTTLDDETTTEFTTSTTTTAETTTEEITVPTTLSTVTSPITTPTPTTTIIAREDTTTTKPETTLPETTVPTITTTTTLGSTTVETTTEKDITTTEQISRTTTTTLPEITTNTDVLSKNELPSTIPSTLIPETTETTLTTQPRTTRSVESILTSTIETTITTTTSSETTTELGTSTTELTTTTELPTTTELSSTTTENDKTTTLRIQRVGRSIVDYFIARYYDDQPSDIYNSDESENRKQTFLVNGKYQESHVHFMTYDVVLPFYYVHNLNALALRFPLDSPKYYLLLVLPVDEEGIDKLICDIGNSVTLKQIVSHMRPTYVRAVIPSFMLRGFVILTSSLQKIGIRQIFEPRHTDFSPMTDDKDIYVTNIEQAITVLIKNYMDPTMINKNRNLYQYGPVEFKATHPFLYFVMDSEIDITLVAGKIVNPINSRIQ